MHANFIYNSVVKGGLRHRHADLAIRLLQDMYYFLQPFTVCTEMLNPAVVAPLVEPCLQRALHHMCQLTDDELESPVRSPYDFDHSLTMFIFF